MIKFTKTEPEKKKKKSISTIAPTNTEINGSPSSEVNVIDHSNATGLKKRKKNDVQNFSLHDESISNELSKTSEFNKKTVSPPKQELSMIFLFRRFHGNFGIKFINLFLLTLKVN